MYSQRQSKVGRLIQKEIADIFQKESNSLSSGSLVTITVVRVSPDLSIAKVYLSIFPSDKTEEVLENIENQSGHIRYLLGNKVRNQLKQIPELKYFPDDSQDYAERIDELLKS